MYEDTVTSGFLIEKTFAGIRSELEDAGELLGKLAPPVKREIVWARGMDTADVP